MPDGLTYGQPVLPGFPVPPPSRGCDLSERVLMRMAAYNLKEAVAMKRLHEAAALADCLFQLASGYVGEPPQDAALRMAEAHEAWDEAQTLRRMGA
jgi:hypothetical protein